MVMTEWPANPSQYELIGKIGQGAFASVWRAKTKEKQECAVKVLNLDHVDSNLSEIRSEVQAMRLSSHPNVLICHTSFVQDRSLWLVTKLMRKGSSLNCVETARAVLRQRNQQPRMEEHILYILRETLVGLKYIHDNGQIHRDIKAGNILLDSDSSVRIADFGVSGWLVKAGSEQERAKTFVGTPCWMAPEVMEQIHGYDYKADIWSLGITALELAKGYAPYAKYPPMKVLILTIQQDPPSLATYDAEDDDNSEHMVEEEWSRSFRTLVNACLQKNPAKRPTCQELLQMKAFTVMNDEYNLYRRKEAVRTGLCDLVHDVGEKGSENIRHSGGKHQMSVAGNSSVAIFMSNAANVDDSRQPGTTWVFADGSQVLASSNTVSATVDDVMDELDQFGQETGGENYDAAAAAAAAERAEAEAAKSKPVVQHNEADDLNDFMDEFELNTGGEEFSRRAH